MFTRPDRTVEQTSQMSFFLSETKTYSINIQAMISETNLNENDTSHI